jgi:histidyl-tRNA synthetase
MGWAAGVERILLAAEPRPPAATVVDLYVARDGAGSAVRAFALADRARGAQLNVQMELAGRSLKGQLRQAARARARYVAIVAGEGTVLKDMQTGEQEDVGSDVDAVVARVLRGRGPAAL